MPCRVTSTPPRRSSAGCVRISKGQAETDILLWILQAILAVKIFTTAISHGFGQSKPGMQESIQKLGRYSRPLHFIVSLLTFLAALSLILPGLFRWNFLVTPLASLVVAVMLLVSTYFHVRTREKPMIFVSLVLFAFAVFIAWGRWLLFPLA